MDVGLTDLELLELSKKMGLKPLTFIGTKDTLYKVKDINDKFFIINLDNDISNGGGGGTHWCACSTFKNYPIYFDSYGLICPTDVENFIKNNFNYKFYYWNKQIQTIGGSYCGYIVLMFLRILYEYILKKKTLFDFINYFESLFNTEDQSKNYYVINNYFNKISKNI